MLKIFESYFLHNLSIKFIKQKKVKKCLNNRNWQILMIANHRDYVNFDYPFCTYLNQVNYQKTHQNVLDPSKKILILGEWQKVVGYYRFLTNQKYKCYLIKS